MKRCGSNIDGLQAADRRDRLIYVLSQINAARGDDAMHVDDESSEASDEEVRYAFKPRMTEPALIASGGRILFTRFA